MDSKRNAHKRQSNLDPQIEDNSPHSTFFFFNSSGRISGGWYIHTQAYCMQRGKACRTHELRIAQRYPRLRPLFFFLVREVFTPPRAYHLLATPDTQGEGIRRKSHVACRHRRVERLILPKRVHLTSKIIVPILVWAASIPCEIPVGCSKPARVYFCITMVPRSVVT